MRNKSIKYCTTNEGKARIMHWSSGAYNVGNSGASNLDSETLYFALLRQECASGASLPPSVLENKTEFGPGRDTGSWGEARFLDASRWYPLPDTKTWEEIQSITGDFNGVTSIAKFNNGSNDHFKIGTGELLGKPSRTRWGYTSPDRVNFVNTGSTGPTGELFVKDCPNAWSNYDGPAYAWVPGMTFAYGLTLMQTSATSSTDTGWTALWKLIDEDTVYPFNMIGPFLGTYAERGTPNIIWTRSIDQ